MTTNLQSNAPETSKTLNYSILIEEIEENLYTAIVWGLPECKASGSTREKAIANVRELLSARLAKAEIVSVEISSPKTETHFSLFV